MNIPSISSELMQQALQRLPSDQQELIILIRVEDLTYAEAGEQMGLTALQVERLLARALVSLDCELRRMGWQAWRCR